VRTPIIKAPYRVSVRFYSYIASYVIILSVVI
jgi:hypothetical protein